MRIRKHNHIKSGTCHTSLQLHVSVIFFLEGKYKGSFGSLSVWLYVFYLSFFFFFSPPITLCLFKKISQVMPLEHVSSITLGSSQGSSLDPLRTEDRIEPLEQQPPPTYPIWSHKFFLIVFLSVLVVVMYK